MIFLIIAIFASSMISIVMRFSQGRANSKYSMLAVNYLICLVCGLFFLPQGGLFPKTEGAGVTLVLGIINGGFYLFALVLMDRSIRKNGVVLPSVFSKLGDLLVPLIIAVIFFSERPAVFQIIGAVLAVGAIIVMNYDPQQRGAGSMASLMLLFVADGLASSMSKIHNELSRTELSPHFLLYTFAVALVLCIIVIVCMGERPGKWDVACGVMIGVPNYFASMFLLKSLNYLKAFIAYPIRSVGSIVVVALAGLLLFREKLNKNQWIAISVIVVAVALLSI